MATAAWPTPPVAEWISTLSPSSMRARSCSPYHAVACALGTAAACASGRPSGILTARSASQVTNVHHAPVGGDARDPVTDLVAGDARAHRGDDSGEVRTELWQPALEARVPTEGDQDVGEVQVRRRDRHLDLTGSGWDTVVGGQFGGLEVAGRANLQTHAVALGVTTVDRRSSGCSGVRLSRAVYHCAVSPRGLVLVGTSQQLRRHQARRRSTPSTSIWVGSQAGMLHPDDPHQTAQAALRQVGDVTRTHRLRAPRHHVQPRRFARDLRQLTRDADEVTDLFGARHGGLGIGLAIAWRGDDDDAAERGGGQLRTEALCVGRVVGV